MWFEYHSQVAWYTRGNIDPQFATTYRLSICDPAPFAMNYELLGKLNEYLPDVVGALNDGTLLSAEAGIKDEKQGEYI